MWTRDMVSSATGLLASGNTETPLRALIYLACSQQPDGGFHQNFWIDGEPYWRGIQLDEVAFPILLAGKLREADALRDFDPYPMGLRAAGYLILQGPATRQERWEENAGYSPSTLASNIAALTCAASFARERGTRRRLRSSSNTRTSSRRTSRGGSGSRSSGPRRSAGKAAISRSPWRRARHRRVHGKARRLRIARAPAARRLDPLLDGRGLRPSDVVAVGGRPDGRSPRRPPPLRLGRAEEPCQRPPDLQQGARLAAQLRALPRRRRDHRPGAHDVPQAREPARGSSDAGRPLGRRRDRLARPGSPDRGRDRAGREARARRPVPRVDATASSRRGRSGRGSTTRVTSASPTSRRSSTSTGSGSAVRPSWSGISTPTPHG